MFDSKPDITELPFHWRLKWQGGDGTETGTGSAQMVAQPANIMYTQCPLAPV
jgi:hypothetical protein